MNERTKIIFLATDCDTTRILYHYLKNYFAIEKVIFESRVNRRQLIKRRLKSLGPVTVTGQILFQTLVNKYLSITSKNRIQEIIRNNNLNVSPVDSQMTVHVDSVNDEGTRKIINELDADVILVNGTRIISKKLLASVKKIFINTHLGITPSYRGVHGGYWALANNDNENFGATIHLVDAGIDTGGVLSYVKTQPAKQDNFTTYPYVQIAAALPVIKEVLERIPSNNMDVLQLSDQKSKLYYHPTIWQYLYNRMFKAVK